jgi:hypothetical protein
MNKLIKNLEIICDFSKYYSSRPAISCGSLRAREIRSILKLVSDEINKLIPSELKTNFSLKTSQGSGSFPKVLWIAFIPNGKRVSNALSICLCFSRDGNGFVAGLMSPTSNRQNIRTIIRDRDKNSLDVDGHSPETKYNDKFVNPEEFFLKTLNEEKLIKHLCDSFNMYLSFQNR